MSGTPPVPIIPPSRDGENDMDRADEALREDGDIVTHADEVGRDAERPLDPDLDDALIDSADADRRAATEGTLDGDA